MQQRRESEQIDRLRQWRELYGLSTQNSSVHTVAWAVSTLYRAAGLPPPAMAWCDGPLQAVFLNMLMQPLLESPIADFMGINAHRAYGDPGDLELMRFSREYIHPLFDKHSIEKWSRQQYARFVDCLFKVVLDPDRWIAGTPDAPEAQNPWGPSAVSMRYDRLTSKALERTPDPRLRWSDNFLRELSTERRRCINIRDLTANAMARLSDYGVMDINLRWHGFTDWLGIHWAIDTPFKDEPLFAEVSAHITLAMHVSAVVFSEDICFLARKPTHISINDRLRAHSEEGPFIEFEDGLEAYAVNGVSLPPDLRDSFKNLDARDIMGIDNTEVRRAIIEWYGIDRFVLESGGKLVHEDQYGQLFRKVMPPGEEPIVIVKVKNSTPEPDGSFRHYFLRVPPTVRTAKEAVAWTFDISPESYAPLRET